MFFVYVDSRSTSITELTMVRCHGACQSIRDFDSAIAYIFSAQAVLAGDARSGRAILSITSGPVQNFEPTDSRYDRKSCA